MLETNYGCKMSNGAGRKADAPLEVLNIIQHARCQIYTTYIYTHTYGSAILHLRCRMPFYTKPYLTHHPT
jgi:hypothetical protein